MSQVVEYILSLKDKLSGGIAAANAEAKGLESTLGTIGETLGVLGISFAAFAGFEALKGAHEVWEKQEFSISQVEAALKSTQGAAGLTFEEIQTEAEKTAHSVKYAQSEILGMQSVLLTFPAITKSSFQPATDIILDMSTRLGQDLKSSAIQVGKALQDPIHGVVALRRVGVNFNETQTETIKKLAQTNHLAQAQGLIMKELNNEFAGSALSAAAADSGFAYAKSMEETRLMVGHLVDELEHKFMPVALRFLGWVKNTVEWVSKNKTEIWGLVKAVGAGFLAFKTATAFIIPFVEGLTMIPPAAAAAAAGEEAVGLAATTALGPIGLLIGSLTALWVGFKHVAEAAGQARTAFLTATQNDEEDFVQQGMEKYKGMKDARQRAMKDEENDLNTRQGTLETALKAEAKTRDDLFSKSKGDVQSLSYDDKQALALASENAETLQRDLDKVDARRKGLTALKAAPAMHPATGTSEAVKAPKTKATGSKSVTIHVSIKELIHDFKISTTVLKESTQQIKQLVTDALTSSINDFQIVAGSN